MKTPAQIMNMSPSTLRRLVAQLQLMLAEQDRQWAGGGHHDDWPHFDNRVANAKRFKRKVYAETKVSK